MGFTRYWERQQREIPLDLWRAALERIRPIITKHRHLIRDVEVSDDVIYFNGSCETFLVLREFQHPDHIPQEVRDHAGMMAFCKTRHDPYDVVVRRCLEILEETLAGSSVGFSVSSD